MLRKRRRARFGRDFAAHYISFSHFAPLHGLKNAASSFALARLAGNAYYWPPREYQGHLLATG
jgi:hypothetical protein